MVFYITHSQKHFIVCLYLWGLETFFKAYFWRQFPTKPSQPEEINSCSKAIVCLGSSSKRWREPVFQPGYVVWPHDVGNNICGREQNFKCALAGKLGGASSELLLVF